MKKIFFPAKERGLANHGWLQAKHSFSFANYYNPSKMNFGVLRVLNDDIVAPGNGFGTHPHDNMEIVTIPLRGALEHKDSMGNSSVIKAGEIQVMSAGSGVTHSEFNPSDSDEVNLFQIWIFPNKRNVEPRYDQFTMDKKKMKNNFLQLVSPNKEDQGTWIHQDAWIFMAEIEEGKNLIYKLKNEENGVYIMVIEGEIEIVEEKLESRDAIGISEVDFLVVDSLSRAIVLLLEIPMDLNC